MLAATRPPGHGFCVFNYVYLELRQSYPLAYQLIDYYAIHTW